MFVLGICSESRYLASSSSLLGRKDEELSDAHSVSVSNFRKLLGGLLAHLHRHCSKPSHAKLCRFSFHETEDSCLQAGCCNCFFTDV